MLTRREFIDALAVGAAGLAVGSTAKSYRQILGSNDRLNFAVIGLNGRAYAHLASLKANKGAARISHVCDVDSTILRKFADATKQEMGEPAATEKDFRKVLAQKEVDAITIATLVGLHHESPPPPYFPPCAPTRCVSSGTAISTPHASALIAATGEYGRSGSRSTVTASNEIDGASPLAAGWTRARSWIASAECARTSVSVSTRPSESCWPFTDVR